MIANSATTYGSATKLLHWTTAILIVALFISGMMANNAPFDTGEELARKANLFSLHKTMGVTLFAVALVRIYWALTQAKPGLLNADKPIEAFAAEIAHWVLYGSLVIVPLTGWISHAASEGFAPIWWPLGQSLPFIPKSLALSEAFGELHEIFKNVLAITLLAHIGGALKHHFWDRDVTLKRMLPGRTEPEHLPPQHKTRLPLFGAVAIFGAVLGISMSSGALDTHEAERSTPQLASVASEWQVQDGTLGIEVTQFGSVVKGQFADWTAAIEFSETPDAEGKHGTVDVQIAIASLTLGTITDQALGPDFFHASDFPVATFKADIRADGEGFVADGTLSIKGTEMPTQLPFELAIENDTAKMTGTTTLQRLDFGVGTSYKDESSVAFAVNVVIELTATKGGK